MMWLKIKQIGQFVSNKSFRFSILTKYGFFNHWSDEKFLKQKFKSVFGYELDLQNPQTFNEKIQWLKLHDRNSLYTLLVDKYEVKKYVARIIGNEYIIPTLGVWDKFEDIDFDKLPNRFVLKCTHDSGGVVICRDKMSLDYQAARKKIISSLKCNYFWKGREWPYKNVKPRIIAEKYIEDEAHDTGPNDFKFMCFNGNVKCSFVCSERFSSEGIKVTFYDRNWKKMPFERHYPCSKTSLKKPINYDEMIEIAEKLSTNIPFVRVDFYSIQNKIYFGEMTFYPGSGMEEFTPSKWDKALGEWIVLPDTNKKCISK